MQMNGRLDPEEAEEVAPRDRGDKNDIQTERVGCGIKNDPSPTFRSPEADVYPEKSIRHYR